MKQEKKSMKCPICERGNLKKKIVSYNVYDVEIGKFPANVCDNCGEEWFDEKTSLKIERLEKEKELFGLSKRSKIGYSGNSLIIRIPRVIVKFMNIKKEEPISIYPQSKDKLIIEV